MTIATNIAQTVVALGLQATGASNIGGAINQYFNPQMFTASQPASNQNSAAYFAGLYLFKIFALAPTNKDLQAIDDYFESFGYRVSRFEKPNIAARDTFTYVQTRDADVTSTNWQAAQQMAAMLNRGTKFWKTDIGGNPPQGSQS